MQSYFSYHPLSSAVKMACYALPVSLLFTGIASATTNDKSDSKGNVATKIMPAVSLDTLSVVVKKQPSRYDTDVSGLSKIVKSHEELARQQVMDIRDMVKYEAGVSVVEQGRGGSSGYSIYGVDKNRVAVTVDGVAQAQSYVDETTNSGNTGSMNEVEIANVYSVEISKGGNGALVGSGALGGSVAFKTKEAKHIIPHGKNHVFKSNSGYTSKDKRYVQTITGAWQNDHWSALVQYTHRQGEGTHVHKDAGRLPHTVTRLGSYEEKWDLRYPEKLSYDAYRWENCTGADCTMYKLFATQDADRISLKDRKLEDLSEQEKAQYHAMQHITETISAKDYAGPERLLPNPMDFKSGSLLFNVGYKPNDNHEFGVVVENTRQQYDSRDMTYCAHLPIPKDIKIKKDKEGNVIADKVCGTELAFLTTYGRTSGEVSKLYPFASATMLSGVHLPHESVLPALKYTRLKMLYETHDKRRISLKYDYNHPLIFDKIRFNTTAQDIQQKTATTKKACSIYPSVDKNCGLSLDKPGAFLDTEKALYREKSFKTTVDFDKKWQLMGADQDTTIMLGASRATANYNRQNYYQMVLNGAELLADKDEQGRYVYRQKENIITPEQDSCYDAVNCIRDPIHHNNVFIGMNHIMRWNKLSLSGSIRYDKDKVLSNDRTVRNKAYKNHSYGLGLNYELLPNLSILAKASTGFRVPSFQELYGFDGIFGNDRKGKYFYIPNLKAETSRTMEVGVKYGNGIIDVEGSVFSSRYRDMIAHASWCRDRRTRALQGTGRTCYGSEEPDYENGLADTGYHNVQNADLQGVNLRGKVDLHALYPKFPEGLEAFASYGQVYATKLFANHPDPEGRFVGLTPRFSTIESYPLEAVQPPRMVYGINYDDPEEKWGLRATWIYSKPKNPDELAFRRVAFGDAYNKETSGIVTKPWMTLDLSGYYHFNNHLSLRAGVNNLLNYRYTTWESARQSSSKGASALTNVGYSPNRYAAPGRNFVVGLEMTF